MAAPKNYILHKDIRSKKYYKQEVHKRDIIARKDISKNIKLSPAIKIVPGQLIMFNYLTPIHKEELEYYDAMPVTIFFNVINTHQGSRVLGFNLHYYPPKIRFWVMNRIFETFKSDFLSYWDKSINKTLSKFNYKFIINALKKYDLDFGVRMYDPKLIKQIYNIPPSYFSTAVFTEGRFKKQTRANILSYWNKWLKNKTNK